MGILKNKDLPKWLDKIIYTDFGAIFERVCQNSLILKKSQSPDFHKPGLCYV